MHQYRGDHWETHGGRPLNIDSDYLDGATADRQGSYLILTSNGGVHPFGPATWYGSDVSKLPSGVSAVSGAADAPGRGYRILRSDGAADSFDATWDGSLASSLPPGQQVIAIASDGGA